MIDTKQNGQRRRESSSRRDWPPLSATDRVAKLGVAICLLASSVSSLAGYLLDSHIDPAGRTMRYTWTVYNEDQAWGLVGFAIEVPVQTRVFARTEPPPYSNPDPD